MISLVRSAALTNYASLAQAAGLDPLRMLRGFGLDPACLDNPDLKIPASAVGRLLEDSAKRSGWQDFGLRLAETRQFAVWGPLALLVREQAKLRHAIGALARYLSVHHESLHVWLEEDHQTAAIRLEFLGREGPVRQSLELSVGMLYRQIQQMLPEAWRARRVCFMHAAPPDARVARRLFSNRVEFAAPFNGIVCAVADLETPLATYARLEQYAQQYVEWISSDQNRSSTETVRQLALTLMPSGTCTLGRIAKLLDVDERTVRRHLLNEGTSYHELLNQIRRELVQRHLGNAPRKHAEIALLLGFSGPTQFSRWFRQQFGCNASAWAGTTWVR
ncbi:AraC family transcriptional regulator [Ottowia sp.]|jgi:AraC-like DNA-binding protein|uniref:AraC family transcriptional regulator n=1 Tax=Ottowia sp. TaxID=1898956 RepID=UPI0025F59DDB|nr:AraC family transcriptional regulator [Ottowia sp.]MBK6613804.1 AraC family transcriptional regulator ligand-binding domain-containing protein [Ottowia sp.]MBK6748401.1 AraC family transcriptional regulator ligand-binding domain-containing protein [Ottowia sp.]